MSFDTGLAGAARTTAIDLAGLEPIERIGRRWPVFVATILTLLMVVALARELSRAGLTGLAHAMPANPLFYLVFLGFYLAPPTFDYFIFRRLWGIPLSGMIALHKKRISNEVLIGYSGEAYFYAWARQHTRMIAAPFGAVKDVMIQSALAGNTMTLLLLLLVAPFAAGLHSPYVNPVTIIGSVAVLVLMSLPFFLFSKRVFSLPSRTLWWVYAMHMVRLFLTTGLSAAAWHLAMPGIALGTWIFLAAVRMLASRLPFVPNKELMFASFAIMLIGSGQQVTQLVTLFAALSLLLHGLLIAVFTLRDLGKKLG